MGIPIYYIFFYWNNKFQTRMLIMILHIKPKITSKICQNINDIKIKMNRSSGHRLWKTSKPYKIMLYIFVCQKSSLRAKNTTLRYVLVGFNRTNDSKQKTLCLIIFPLKWKISSTIQFENIYGIKIKTIYK